MYGWIKDKPDARDHVFSMPHAVSLPDQVDMRSQCPMVYNQGNLGSCTAQSVAGALHFTMMEAKQQSFVPARLFIYYNTRVIEGTVDEDSGASLRDTIKACAKAGYAQEMLWPYRISDFDKRPTPEAYGDAMNRKLKALYYQRLPQDLNAMRMALAQNNPVVFGFSVYESFQSNSVAKTGVMPMPKKKEKILGGHAVCLVGYSDPGEFFIVRNSWGQGWGTKGYFFMPYQFISNFNYASDFWVIKGVAPEVA